MLKSVNSCALFGLECVSVEVEVDVCPGFPSFHIIGLPDSAINEARERIKAALKNTAIPFPYTKRVLVNLAPAHIRKVGPSYDLPMVVGILLHVLGDTVDVSSALFIGELSLDGRVRPVRGVLSMALFAKKSGMRSLFVPYGNRDEACLVSGVDVYAVSHVSSLVAHLKNERLLTPVVRSSMNTQNIQCGFDMQEIRGQKGAKRALEIAAAGGHNLLLTGPPGSGKTLLARTLPSLLPALSDEEMLEVTQIYSVAGVLPTGVSIVRSRPFRSPHHSMSPASLLGGGRFVRPGEVTLAHRGVLFLDELPEFSQQMIDSLRQPLEDGEISVVRVNERCIFPASFMLLAAMNPCPCGFSGCVQQRCTCSLSEVQRYQKKVSGPILDRFDMRIEVPKVAYEDMVGVFIGETSNIVRKRVAKARYVQVKRLKNSGRVCNAELSQKHIEKFCLLDSACTQLLQQATNAYDLSARGYFRVIRVARTIADLAQRQEIQEEDIAEALQFRLQDLSRG